MQYYLINDINNFALLRHYFLVQHLLRCLQLEYAYTALPCLIVSDELITFSAWPN